MAGRASRLVTTVLTRAEHRLPALTRLRRRETLPVRLDRKRVYILPTAYGIGFTVILFVMLLGALNYGNNAAMLLTCLLGAVAVNSLLQTFRVLDGLIITGVHAASVVAGDAAQVEVRCAGAGRRRPAVTLGGWNDVTALDVAADGDSSVTLAVATRRRGWMELPRLKVASSWPFGWFHAWSWIAPARRILVYPRAECGGPPPPPRSGEDAARRRAVGDEWSALREYRPGDPLRIVAWRASARGDDLRVKTFDRACPDRNRDLDWKATAGLAYEQRIARLARWIGEAYRADTTWALSLPAASFPADRGEAHYHRCLRALAELP